MDFIWLIVPSNNLLILLNTISPHQFNMSKMIEKVKQVVKLFHMKQQDPIQLIVQFNEKNKRNITNGFCQISH